MTAEQWLNDLEAKANAATPGDWFPDGYDVQTENDDACVCCCNANNVNIESEDEQEANCHFIAAANPAAVKRLVAMVRSLALRAGDAGCPSGWKCEDDSHDCHTCNIQHAYQQTEHMATHRFVAQQRDAARAEVEGMRKEVAHYKRALDWLGSRELLIDDFAAPCQCEERHDTPCAFGEDPEQCCPKYNFRGTGSCWIQESLDATKEAASE